MTDERDFNTTVIDEFRSRGGRVGGYFEGVPLLLLHHRGRHSGQERVTPVAYQRSLDDDATVYVFASKGGAPDNPAWYWNLTASGRATVEVGEETYEVTVTELQGAERETVFARQVAAFPAFAQYAEQTAGVRVIPVLALTRLP